MRSQVAPNLYAHLIANRASADAEQAAAQGMAPPLPPSKLRQQPSSSPSLLHRGTANPAAPTGKFLTRLLQPRERSLLHQLPAETLFALHCLAEDGAPEAAPEQQGEEAVDAVAFWQVGGRQPGLNWFLWWHVPSEYSVLF